MNTIITNTATLEQLTVFRQLTIEELTEILNRYNWKASDCTVITTELNQEVEA